MLKLWKLVMLLCLYAHWQACAWGLFSSYTDEPNWLSNFDDNFAASVGRLPSPLDMYMAGLHFSVMTLTSIGYGDIVPLNSAERAIGTACMMLSGMVWTYAIGSVTAIAVTLDPNRVQFENTMDALNYFCRECRARGSIRRPPLEAWTELRGVHACRQSLRLA